MVNQEKAVSVVIDNGSRALRAGFAGDEQPQFIYPAVDNSQEKVAQSNRFDIKYPVENGIVTNWDDMEKIWHHIFNNELHVDPSKHSVLLTESPLNPKPNREKMIEIMFETFKVPATYVSVQSVLSLYASGRTNGIVLESKDDFTYAVPVDQGYAVRNAITRLEIAGGHVTDHLMQMLNNNKQRGCIEDRKIAAEIKEKLCYVALNFDKEKCTEKSFTLPNQQVITVGNEQFHCTELLFKPNGGIHELIQNSITKCADETIRKNLYANIVLTGGNTMFNGLSERLEKEVAILAPSAKKIKIVTPLERKHSAWKGGSLVTALPTFTTDLWVSKKEYEEFGASIVNKKCL